MHVERLLTVLHGKRLPPLLLGLLLTTTASAAGAAPDPVRTPVPVRSSAPPPVRPSAPAPDPAPAPAPVPVIARSWPVGVRPVVVRGWDPPATPYARGHRGVDLAAPAGAPVRAVAAGRVLFAGQVAGRGVVSLELAGTGTPPLRTTYTPVRPSVSEGDEVTPSQPVGTLAATPSHCAVPCLHWGLRRDQAYLNPLSLLPAWLSARTPARLLPVLGVPLP
ncbi:murein hydrolase activator EnvC family protein [Streptomyces sp. NPDC014882]|uniref:murein hydrolase activator EnvC family protein n=1 Tax=Streptomyces sp. NPDC014882 TaxID=3364927 RepID=UPI003702B2A8